MSNIDINILLITALVTFVFIWGYAFYRWGFLMALTVGWLPAVVGAGVVTMGFGLIFSSYGF